MEQFLLSNNWTTDPYSQGYPGNAVAARFDIKGGPVTGSPYDHEFNFFNGYRYDSWWEQGTHGSTDGKVIYASTVKSLTIRGISGPPVTADCPPFSWDDPMWSSELHVGHPTTFNFEWQDFCFGD